MEISKLTREHKIKAKIINQASLTSDCWSVQFWGLESCKTCEHKGTEECGGKKILKKIEKGTFAKTGLPDRSNPRRLL